MKKWQLGNGLSSNDTAWFQDLPFVGPKDDPRCYTKCKIIKVRGEIPPGEDGNVLIEIDGQRIWVMGSKLFIDEELNEN